MDANPYAAPAALDNPPALPLSDPETIRQQHLSHEASIKSIGTLYLISFLIFGGIGITQIVSALLSGSGAGHAGASAGSGAVLLGFAAFQFAVGRGLRLLQKSARGVAAILAGIGLIGFPIGTGVGAYILYLLMSQKGQMVFSPQYQEVIAATPHMKYKTSLLVKICVGFLAFIILLSILLALFGAASRH